MTKVFVHPWRNFLRIAVHTPAILLRTKTANRRTSQHDNGALKASTSLSVVLPEYISVESDPSISHNKIVLVMGLLNLLMEYQKLGEVHKAGYQLVKVLGLAFRMMHIQVHYLKLLLKYYPLEEMSGADVTRV